MRGFHLWGFMVLLLGASSPFHAFTNVKRSFHSEGVESSSYGTEVKVATESQKIKEDGSTINLEDYHPIDPVPTSKAIIKSGPIEHGTPLIPYIPHPAPPSEQPTHPGPP